MVLPASGSISLNTINTELGNTPTAFITMNDTRVRDLADAPSGSYWMSNFYGKSRFPMYRYLRWYIYANKGSGDFQVGEFQCVDRYGNHCVNGIVPYHVTPHGGGGSESYVNISDGSISTKFFMTGFVSGGSFVDIRWDMGSVRELQYYLWYTANDNADRDPRAWYVQGSNDGSSFVTLSSIDTVVTNSRGAHAGTWNMPFI